MKKLFTFFIICIFLFPNCQEDNYGQLMDEIISDVELTKEDLLTGFYNDKYWKITSFEFDNKIFKKDSVIKLNTFSYQCGNTNNHINQNLTFDSLKIQFGVDNIQFRKGDTAKFYFKRWLIIDSITDIINNGIECIALYNEKIFSNQLFLCNWQLDEKDSLIYLDGFFGESEDTYMGINYENKTSCKFTFKILELSKEKLLIKWLDPLLERSYKIQLTVFISE